MTDAALIEAVQLFTLTGPVRCQAMIDAVRHVDRAGIDGAVVECGVWRGGNIILARHISPDRVCWLYDTFTGMTEPCEHDTKYTGASALWKYDVHTRAGTRWCEASLEEVTICLTSAAVYQANRLKFVVGDVCKTLIQPENVPDRIALLRLDTDFYASTLTELEILYPRLASGGVLIVDDYGHWNGCRRAVTEYFEGQDVQFTEIDYTAVSMVKP